MSKGEDKSKGMDTIILLSFIFTGLILITVFIDIHEVRKLKNEFSKTSQQLFQIVCSDKPQLLECQEFWPKKEVTISTDVKVEPVVEPQVQDDLADFQPQDSEEALLLKIALASQKLQAFEDETKKMNDLNQENTDKPKQSKRKSSADSGSSESSFPQPIIDELKKPAPEGSVRRIMEDGLREK